MPAWCRRGDDVSFPSIFGLVLGNVVSVGCLALLVRVVVFLMTHGLPERLSPAAIHGLSVLVTGSLFGGAFLLAELIYLVVVGV